MNPSRPRAACAGSHKYLPLKGAALSLETTTSWAVKREKKKRRKRGKKEKTTTRKNPTRHLTSAAGTQRPPAPTALLTPAVGSFAEGEATHSLSAFPVPFPVLCSISPVFCSLLRRHAVLSTPSSSAASLRGTLRSAGGDNTPREGRILKDGVKRVESDRAHNPRVQ